jgi:hypothetical protein
MSDTVPWLNPEEQRASWAFIRLNPKLSATVGSELQSQSGLSGAGFAIRDAHRRPRRAAAIPGSGQRRRVGAEPPLAPGPTDGQTRAGRPRGMRPGRAPGLRRHHRPRPPGDRGHRARAHRHDPPPGHRRAHPCIPRRARKDRRSSHMSTACPGFQRAPWRRLHVAAVRRGQLASSTSSRTVSASLRSLP